MDFSFIARIFNRRLSGQTRARITQVLTVIAFILAVLSTVDWSLPIGLLIPALIQTIAHDTSFGDSTTPKNPQ